MFYFRLHTVESLRYKVIAIPAAAVGAVVGLVAGEEMIKKVVTVTINVTVGTAKVAWWVAISPLRLIVDYFRDGVRDLKKNQLLQETEHPRTSYHRRGRYDPDDSPSAMRNGALALTMLYGFPHLTRPPRAHRERAQEESNERSDDDDEGEQDSDEDEDKEEDSNESSDSEVEWINKIVKKFGKPDTILRTPIGTWIIYRDNYWKRPKMVFFRTPKVLLIIFNSESSPLTVCPLQSCMGRGEKTTPRVREFVREHGLANDEAGHLVACCFGGLADELKDNMVGMNLALAEIRTALAVLLLTPQP